MELTFIGLTQIVIGSLILIAGRLRHAFVFLIGSCLLGASAAINLPAIGGSSIQPSEFALLFVFMRIFMPGSRTLGNVTAGFRANKWLALFGAWGIASAIILPRLYAGTMQVAPMKALETNNLFATVPLEPTPQNLTTAFYLLGALLVTIASWVLLRRPGMDRVFIKAMLWITWLHILTGIVATIVRDTPADIVFDVFRNANYDQMDDAIGGFVRIRGLMAEASSYAGVGIALFVTNAEMWYRSIRPRATGSAAMAMGLVLLFSTSSTAYIGLAAYHAFFTLRTLALPGIAHMSKAGVAIAAAGAAVCVAAAIFIVLPELVYSLVDVIEKMTVGKSESDSSLQRTFWAMQGWDAFKHSWGIGIGAGSFRSSSLLMAIVGSMGLVGIATFAMYLINLFQPLRRSTWARSDDPLETLGGALGVAAVLALIPSMVAAPAPVPTSLFSLLAGASLAFRPIGAFSASAWQDPWERSPRKVTSGIMRELKGRDVAQS